jgi:hypothetical protein
VAALEQARERAARADEVRLADELLERPWPHPRREGDVGHRRQSS